MDPQDESPLGSYRVSTRIATGGMAEVYLGWRLDPVTGEQRERVAIKKLLPHLKGDRNIVQMFLNEARIIAQIRHPNVVQIHALGSEAGEWFIAMELLEGRSFADLRTRAAEMGKRVPLGVTLRILADACRGLDAAHRARDEQGRELRIVHRDFTPENVHVGVDGQVKVIDFGIAKANNIGVGTEPGTLKGKFFYMSPEMIAGQPVDHRADLFAAGVMLYEQLCGRRPFTGGFSDEVLAKIAEGRPKRPREFDPSVPEALEEICLQALRREPSARFPSLAEFVQAIEAVGGSAELATAEQVGDYVCVIFPAEHDEQRRKLQQARLADPSLPDVAADAHVKVREEPAPPRVATPPPAAEPRAWSPPDTEEAPPPRRRWPLVAAIALVLALGGGFAALKLRPTPPPSELIGRALRTPAKERGPLLQELGKDDRATMEELVRAAGLLMEAGLHEPLLVLAADFSARHPRELVPPLYEARAAIALRQGKRAKAAIDRARALAPEDARPDLLLGELEEAQGNLSAALDAFSRARKRSPSDLELSYRLGFLQSQAGRLEEADATLTAALGRRFDAKAAAELGFVKFRRGQEGEARRHLKSALAKEPKLAVAHYYLGAVLFSQGEVSSAERAYREADELAPTDSRALAALCQVLAHRKDRAGVDEVRRQMAARFPAEAERLKGYCGS